MDKYRFELYCLLLREYLNKPTEELRNELELLKDGYIPLKYMIKQ